MTDLLAGYTKAIKEVFGRQVTIAKCHFHFHSDINDNIRRNFGSKKSNPLFFSDDFKTDFLKELKNSYDPMSQFLKKKLKKELQDYDKYPYLSFSLKYLPNLLRVVENERVKIKTNNACELVIRHFTQRYKLMNGFATIETAQRHAKIFQLIHRFTPLSDDADVSKRGRAPLQLAGYKIDHMPIFQYLTQPLLCNVNFASTLATLLIRNAA